jgi:hypothetical protein
MHGGLGDTYRRWAAGACPCCAGEMGPSWSTSGGSGRTVPPRAIGEGVEICGECVKREHDDPLTADAILRAIAARSDKPIDDLLASIGPG